MIASKFHAFHWPDHVISKRESRRIRDEHNELFNSHAELLEALRRLVSRALVLDQSATVDGLANCDALAQARAAIAKTKSPA